MFSLEYLSSALDSLPSADRRADRASKTDNGAVSPGFLQLRAGQLGGTLTTSRILLQQRDTRIDEDDCILGELPLPFGVAV
jgi:hypothetical protein